jgi:hypothetical protein
MLSDISLFVFRAKPVSNLAVAQTRYHNTPAKILRDQIKLFAIDLKAQQLDVKHNEKVAKALRKTKFEAQAKMAALEFKQNELIEAQESNALQLKRFKIGGPMKKAHAKPKQVPYQRKPVARAEEALVEEALVEEAHVEEIADEEVTDEEITDEEIAVGEAQLEAQVEAQLEAQYSGEVNCIEYVKLILL